MKFQDLCEIVPPNGIFTTGQILAGQRSPADVRRQLVRWVKRGRVFQLRRGVYAMREPYAKMAPHPFAAANALKRASYVSLESSLSYYGMIPEFVPVTTSITTGRPDEIETELGAFQFRHVSTDRFFGFSEREVVDGQSVRIADPEKALVDLLYLTSGSDDWDYLRELRLELPDGFSGLKLERVADQCRSSKTRRACRRILELHNNEVGR